MIHLIAAVDRNGGIGKDNDLLCHISADLKRFKSLTMGHTMLMGRKTFDSLPYSDNLVGEYERYYNLPIRWKHTVSAGWARGDWAHTLTQVYRGGYKDWKPGGVVNGYNPPAWDGNVDAYITYNYSLTWTGMENLKATFGIRNLLNTDPPFTAHQVDFASGAAWEPRVADPRGRSFNLQVEYRFN